MSVADLARNKFPLTTELTTPNDYIRDWMIRLCTLVNRQIAIHLNIALTDDHITLIETAELEGYKSRNLVSCLMDRFQRVLGKSQPTKLTAQDEVQLLKRAKDRRVWVIVDDLDVVAPQNLPLKSTTGGRPCRARVHYLTPVYYMT